jgi:hypothetical protein
VRPKGAIGWFIERFLLIVPELGSFIDSKRSRYGDSYNILSKKDIILIKIN